MFRRLLLSSIFTTVLASLAIVTLFMALGQHVPDNTVAFVSTRTGNRDIFVVDVNRGTAVNLTKHPATDEDPSWSPTGTHILFVSNREGRPTISNVYIMEATGRNLRRITGYDERRIRYPVWSPDGTQIGFVYYRDSLFAGYIMNVDGGEIDQPATMPIWLNDAAFQSPSTLSVDRQWMAVTRQVDGNWDVYLARINGQIVRRLTTDIAIDDSPDWRP